MYIVRVTDWWLVTGFRGASAEERGMERIFARVWVEEILAGRIAPTCVEAYGVYWKVYD